jgi:hypothetical protein
MTEGQRIIYIPRNHRLSRSRLRIPPEENCHRANYRPSGQALLQEACNSSLCQSDPPQRSLERPHHRIAESSLDHTIRQHEKLGQDTSGKNVVEKVQKDFCSHYLPRNPSRHRSRPHIHRACHALRHRSM